MTADDDRRFLAARYAIGDLTEENEALYLEALVEDELITMMKGTGLGPHALIDDCCAALGLSYEQAWTKARQRAFARLPRPPKNDAVAITPVRSILRRRTTKH
jgi:hypothetical protein